jgi:hypothetical protein
MADRGGKRLGAGRKPSTLKGIAQRLPNESSALILAEIKADVPKRKWHGFYPPSRMGDVLVQKWASF